MGNGSLAWANERKKIKAQILKLLHDNENLTYQLLGKNINDLEYDTTSKAITSNLDTIKLLLAKI